MAGFFVDKKEDVAEFLGKFLTTVTLAFLLLILYFFDN